MTDAEAPTQAREAARGPPLRRTLSALLIVKDEADRIEACLHSIAGWVDEIIVLDSGSTDATVDIVRRYTDKVWVTDWPGYGAQRNRALARCRCDWVFAIDADERVTAGLREEIDRRLSDPDMDRTLLTMPWRTLFYGKPLRFGRYSARKSRLFQRDGAHYRDDQVHEELIVPGARVGHLAGILEHDSWRDYLHVQEKHLHYAWLMAQQRHAAGKRGTLTIATLRFFTDFFRQYLLRLSILDGWRGFLISIVVAQYAFHKYAALMTLDHAPRGGEQTAANIHRGE